MIDDTDFAFYERSNIHDRIIEEAEKKFGSLPKAAKALNRHATFFYNESNLSSVKSVINFCEKANVSVEYILTGKNYGPYKKTLLSGNAFLRVYKAQKGRQSQNKAICMLAYKIRHGHSQNITLLSLLRVSDLFKVPIMDLIGD